VYAVSAHPHRAATEWHSSRVEAGGECASRFNLDGAYGQGPFSIAELPCVAAKLVPYSSFGYGPSAG
jgi:hypothetical protein